MRVLACVLFLTACHPSATVERTMPVANLKTYHSIGVRVHASQYASQQLASTLEASTLDKLHRKCGFEQVGRADQGPSDVVLDLNITNAGRGGTGWIQNQNQAFIDTLVVLSDGQSNELLGTARIHGQSSGMLVNGAPPEAEALEEIAKSVSDLLAKSGCSGPRIAKAPEPAEPPPTVNSPPTGTGSGSAAVTPPAPDESKRAEADQLNAQGATKLQSADLPGALADFQHANSVLPDAKYEFNVCLTYEAQQQWDNAVAACKQARAMNPQAKLLAKIDHRLDLLAHHQ